MLYAIYTESLVETIPYLLAPFHRHGSRPTLRREHYALLLYLLPIALTVLQD